MTGVGPYQIVFQLAFLQFKEKGRGIERGQEGGKEGKLCGRKGKKKKGAKHLVIFIPAGLFFIPPLCHAYTEITA